jgi:hypothetical protein
MNHNIQLVERMTLPPAMCMKCGKGNTPDGETGEVGPFLDMGLEYNWGDSGYLCMDCVALMAVTANWISPDTKKDLERRIKKLEAKIHDKDAEIEVRAQRERAAIRRARGAEAVAS